ncbi:MAG: pilus assembly protein TadG-related protein [Hyphomicrobium sp.]
MRTHWPLALKSFERDEQGAAAVLFALMSFALFFLSGMAIDQGRIYDVRSRMADAVDSASLAAGRAMLDGKLTDEEIVDLAKTYFTENSKTSSNMTKVAIPQVTIDRASGTVDISVQADVSMTLTRLGGYESVNVPVASSAVYQQSDIEVGMALDITGSMEERISGVRKIDALKSAFKEFTTELFPANAASSQKVRVALAPYSGSVKLGAYAATASGGKSVDGCITESKSGSASDAKGLFYVKDDGIKDVDPTGGLTSVYDCAKSKPAITPLSDKKDNLDDIVDDYTAGGFTGGHFGVQWAWNMISENWGGTFSGDSKPAPYSDVDSKKVMKAVVLMTDGEFNTAFHGKTSAKQSLAICEAIRQKDVVVFTVGFGLGKDPTALDTLKSCATPGGGYFANAENEAELTAIFRQFASTLSQLRISK